MRRALFVLQSIGWFTRVSKDRGMVLNGSAPNQSVPLIVFPVVNHCEITWCATKKAVKQLGSLTTVSAPKRSTYLLAPPLPVREFVRNGIVPIGRPSRIRGPISLPDHHATRRERGVGDLRRVSAVLTFLHQGFTLAYRIYGRGPRPAIAFHGYGGTGRNFEKLEEALKDRFTTYAVDIFFHGESSFPTGRSADEPITPEEFTTLMHAFMDHLGVKEALMIGFSLGGRLALTCIERMPERCSGLWLFAPDGLVRFPWYRAASKWGWGRSIYRRFVTDPRRVHWLFDRARDLRFISDRRHQFLKGHTSDTIRRQLVYDVWLSLRLLEPDLRAVGANLKKHELRAEVFLGRYDKVIRPAWGKNLKRHAPDRVHLHLLETGHQVVSPDLGSHLASLR